MSVDRCADERAHADLDVPPNPDSRSIWGEPGAAARANPSAPDTRPVPILVTTDRDLGRPTEIVGVLDFHSSADSDDKG